MDRKRDIEEAEKFNRDVFASMPDTPYLGPVPDVSRHRRKVSAADWCFRIAAAILLPLAVWGLLRNAGDRTATPEFTAKAADVYTVANGVRSKVVLPDSSVVWLNCGSRMLVADNFAQGNREVSLQGEGYFKVRSNPSSPFYVRTPSGPTVKVTGTVFNLSCYSPDKEINVTLLEGSVEIVTGKETFTLKKGTKMTVKGDFNSTELTPDIDGDTAWTRGTLHFDNTSMRDVIASLERWYGVRITVLDNSVYRKSFTADFQSESITQVLELIAITCGITYTIDGSDIVIG